MSELMVHGAMLALVAFCKSKTPTNHSMQVTPRGNLAKIDGRVHGSRVEGVLSRISCAMREARRRQGG